MKQVCGIDVHKEKIFCGIYHDRGHGEVKEYQTLTPSIQEMGKYLKAEGVVEVAMESTCIYWVPVWNILEEMGFTLILVNPYMIKQMPGRKRDVKDAQWIAQLLHKGLLRASLVPCKEIRELRTYSRKYVKLQQKMTCALNEMERILELCSIRLSCLVSNISSKSLLRVIRLIVQGETDPEVFLNHIHKRVINTHTEEKVKRSLTGFITDHHRFILGLALEEYEMLTRQCDDCLVKMDSLCDLHYKKEMELLQTIPGISRISALIIIAETGGDMKVFETSNRFSAWTGLRPRNDESAGKYKSTATTKGNRYLRSVLVQVAWAATRTKGSYFKEKFIRLSMRKSRKKALIAIARKIGVLAWNILYYQNAYDPNLQVVLDPGKLHAKMNYHQKEVIRLEKLIKR